MGTGSRSNHQPNQLQPASGPPPDRRENERDEDEALLLAAAREQARPQPPSGDGDAGRAQAVAEQAHARTATTEQLTAEHVESVQLQEQARRDRPEPEVSYTDDFAAFQADYNAARARRGQGEALVPYMSSNATDGLGDRHVGRGFGVELEFDLGTDAAGDQTALRRIAGDLREAGLTRQPAGAAQYHAAARRGYSDDPAGWSLEHDASVAGELVSPILYDEPRTWRDLATACEIIQRHGGRPTVHTGSHVHVSLHDYDHTIANHNQLLNLATNYQDTLYRIASNPHRRRHRGTIFCQPNQHRGEAYHSVATLRARHQSHSLGVNFQAVHGEQRDHVEYRMFDGSLDPGTIQTQIKLALGMTDAAFRTAGTNPDPDATVFPRLERIGSHHRLNPENRRLTGDQWQHTTASYRRLADTLFTRAADKAQATAIFANTRWPT